MKDALPEEQLAGFLAKFDPEIADLGEKILAKMRSRLKGAIEMVYDNTYALVIGFSPTERPSEALFSIVIAPRKVSLCFLTGVKLPDPEGILEGEGNQVRHIRLESVKTLDRPVVKTLMREAIDRSDKQFSGKTPNQVVIRAIAKKQRPRRPKKSK